MLGLHTALVVFSGRYSVARKGRLSAVTHLDATCITEMLRMHALRRAKGFARETVILHQPAIRRLFDVFRVHDVLSVVDSLDDARANHRFAPIVQYAFYGATGSVPSF